MESISFISRNSATGRSPTFAPGMPQHFFQLWSGPFPFGIVISSDETAQTYNEKFERLGTTIEYLMADGEAAITKAKM